MRTIKFRAWDKTNKRMLSDWCDIIISALKEPIDPIVLMQFTGLHDKNNKPIYESDWLGGMYESLYVGWCDKQGGWELFTPGAECMGCLGDVHWMEVVEDQKELEVVGNIYQDSHLLEDKV